MGIQLALDAISRTRRQGDAIEVGHFLREVPAELSKIAQMFRVTLAPAADQEVQLKKHARSERELPVHAPR
jgi:hypothetical protein